MIQYILSLPFFGQGAGLTTKFKKEEYVVIDKELLIFIGPGRNRIFFIIIFEVRRVPDE